MHRGMVGNLLGPPFCDRLAIYLRGRLCRPFLLRASLTFSDLQLGLRLVRRVDEPRHDPLGFRIGLCPRSSRMPPSQDDYTPKERAEHQAMKDAVSDLFMAWSRIEDQLAMILNLIIGPERANVATAIYFAPNNLETRIRIVERALVAHMKKRPYQRKIFIPIWSAISNTITASRAPETSSLTGA